MSGWDILLISSSLVATFFAFIYVILYLATQKFWTSHLGIHLAFSMVSIVLVLGSWCGYLITKDPVWLKPLAIAFIPLAVAQIWRVTLLIIGNKMAEKEKDKELTDKQD